MKKLKKIIKNKPKGATHWYNNLYLYQLSGGIWFAWFDGEWCRYDNRYSSCAIYLGG